MSEDNNSPMADALEAMLPVQQRTMLQATLAGCEIIGCVGPGRKVWNERLGYLKMATTVYIVLLPNGAQLHDHDGLIRFDDAYEAACAAVAYMERSEPKLFTDPPGFKLNEGNEQ